MKKRERERKGGATLKRSSVLKPAKEGSAPKAKAKKTTNSLPRTSEYTPVSRRPSPFAAAHASLVAKQSFRRRDGFSISSIGNCAAQQLFGIAGFERGNPPPPRTLLTWRLGNLIEAEVYYLLEQEAGYPVVGKQKQLVGENPPREGHIDGYILIDGKLWLFDAKSSNARSFDEWLSAMGESKWGVMKSGLATLDPNLIADTSYRAVRQVYESYYLQAQGYLELINNNPVYQHYRIDNMSDVSPALAAAAIDGAVPVSTEGMYFYVVCKDDSRILEEFVPFDREVIEARLAVLATALAATKGAALGTRIEVIQQYREVPLKEDGSLHWKCVRCPFVEVCRP